MTARRRAPNLVYNPNIL
jgi:hypothetical protein